MSDPDLSVIIPVLNAAATLSDQLSALSRQTYRGPWELILVDNGSTDGSLAVADYWGAELPFIRLVDASSTPGAAAARNAGVRAARSSRIAFTDADDVVAAEWVEALIDAMRENDFVTGPMDDYSLNRGITVFRRREWTGPQRWGDFLAFAPSSNMAMWKTAFDDAGGFIGFPGLGAAGEDVDLSFRLQLGGHELHFTPRARVAYRHRRTLRGLWKQNVQYGRATVAIYKRFRAHGIRWRPRAMVSSYLKLVLGIPRVFRTEGRVEWIKAAAWRWGLLLGSIQERTVYL